MWLEITDFCRNTSAEADEKQPARPLLTFRSLRPCEVGEEFARLSALSELPLPQDEICSFDAGSFLGWRFTNVICLMRAESDGLQVATSGSSLKAL